MYYSGTLKNMNRGRRAQYIRNFIFGVEDSLVSTVGLLSGIAITGIGTKTIVLAGVVLIFVEAFSMGAGSLLSDNSEEEYMAKSHVSLKKSVFPSTIMFFSYFLTGFIPLAPYFIFKPYTALLISITLALLALFILGTISGIWSRSHIIRQGLTMLFIGGVAIILGVVVGIFVDSF